MTSEELFRSELLARFARLEEHIHNLNAEFLVVKALLNAPCPAPPVPAASQAMLPVALPALEPPPPVAIAAPVIPSVPPVPDDPRVRKSRKRGWIMARIEQLVAEGGPTFSFNTIFDAYEAKWGWKSYPSRGTIGTILWKVVRKHGHLVVSESAGRRSAVYERKPVA